MFNDLLSYGKKSWNILVRNPKILWTMLLELLISVGGITGAVLLMGTIKLTDMANMSNIIFKSLLLMVPIMFLSLLVWVGQLNMIKVAVSDQEVKWGLFFTGIKKYTIRYIVGGFSIILISLVLGAGILACGFFIMLIARWNELIQTVLIFSFGIIMTTILCMWQTVLIHDEDETVMEAILASLSFVKKNFWTLAAVQLLFKGIGTLSSIWNIPTLNSSFNLQYIGNLKEMIYTSSGLTTFFIYVAIITIIFSILKLLLKIFYFVYYREDGTPKVEVITANESVE